MLAIPVETSCEPCLQDIYDKILSLQEKYPTSNLYPFLIFKDEFNANIYTNRNPKLNKISRLYYDNKGVYYKYIYSHTNPILYYIEDNKVVKTQNYEVENPNSFNKAIKGIYK